jgi:hypothetical protein
MSASAPSPSQLPTGRVSVLVSAEPSLVELAILPDRRAPDSGLMAVCRTVALYRVNRSQVTS